MLLVISNTGMSQLKLPALIRDSMVLQRDTQLNIWGWASPGEKVSVKFKGKNYRTTADKNGKWMTQLAPAAAGGPFIMEISGRNRLTLRDILIGDVWLCSGQSNMVHQMELHSELYGDDIAKANFPQIRQFHIPNKVAYDAPQDDLPASSWKWANPEDVKKFSAVAYFFAKKIYEREKVPVGIINASWGGSAIEAWMSEDALKDFETLYATVQRNKDTAYVNGIQRNLMAANSNAQPQTDKGMLAEPKWFHPSYQPVHWRPINIPGYWEDQGIKDLDGVVWYRREIEVPASMTNEPARVFLGRIVDADALYINGQMVGTTGYMYPQRRYNVPAGVLKPGKNLFVIRVTNNAGKGGFIPDKPYQLIAGDTIDLKGTWHYKVGQVKPITPAPVFLSPPNQPAGLYNAMIAPMLNYNIRGIAWYQGETNSGNPQLYAKLVPAFLENWRSKFNQGALPFLNVQLPNFMDVQYSPVESRWAETREVQADVLSLPNTALAVTIDLGEWNDIHPDRKKEVGERLALGAQRLVYGDTITITSGPVFKSAAIDGNRIVVSFTNTGKGLTTMDGQELSEFAIAGKDKKFVWAKATIEGDKVVVTSDAVTSPMYVRYAWADNPFNPNLTNSARIPASPFRTDR